MPTPTPATPRPAAERSELCQTISDLYLRTARDTIYLAMPAFFAEHQISVVELIHNADWLRVLENNEMLMRSAVQRAVMYHVKSSASAREMLGQLEKLTIKARAQLRADSRSGLFPAIETATGFAALADRLTMQANGLYLLNGALTLFLRDAKNINVRILRLMTVLESSDDVRPGWRLLHGAIDQILSELLRIPNILPDLIGDTKDYGEQLSAAARLFLSQPVHGRYGKGQGLDLIAWHFAAGDFPVTHRTLAGHIKAGIGVRRNLSDGPPREEMERFKQLYQLVMRCVGPHLRRREIQPELDVRSARLASPEQVHQCLEEYPLPDQKVAKLFFIESCICDVRSRYRLADMIFRMSATASFRERLLNPNEILTDRLHRLAELSRCAIRSRFDQDQRLKMASFYDHLACDLANRENLFPALEQRFDNIAERTVNIARLFYAGHITEGKLARAARKRMMYYTRQSGFLDQYIAFRSRRDGKSLDRTQALIDIGLGMKRVGIDPEIALYRVTLPPMPGETGSYSI